MRNRLGVWAMSIGVVWSISCTSTLSSDQQASAAVKTLKLLGARVDTGISRGDYAASVAEASVAVSDFLDGRRAATAVEFSNQLKEALKWHRAAARVWDRMDEAPVPVGYCASKGRQDFSSAALCAQFPDLVTQLPGSIPSTGNSRGFSIAELYLEFMLAAVKARQSPDTKSSSSDWSRGIIYELGIQECWRRASFFTKNADSLSKGEAAEKPDQAKFKAGRNEELKFLYDLAVKRQDATR